MADDDPRSAQDLSQFTEMGERIDDLEKHVTDLMAQAGIENTNEDLMFAENENILIKKYRQNLYYIL
ncbi:unnamed protein product [Natator depressus]